MSLQHRDSLVEIERDAELQRQRLTASLDQLHHHLQPASLAEEAGEQLKFATSKMLNLGAAAAKTPAGIGTALGTIAVGAIAIGLKRKSAPASFPVSSKAVQVLPPEPRRPHTSGLAAAAASLGAALVVGAAISKLIPASGREQDLLKDVGSELKAAFEEWARREAANLVHPHSGQSFGPINAAAMGVGLLFGATKSKNSI